MTNKPGSKQGSKSLGVLAGKPTTFNIWKFEKNNMGPTGPWVFASACVAESEAQAIETAKIRHGLGGEYKVYESV